MFRLQIDNGDLDCSISVGGGSDVGIVGCDSLPDDGVGGEHGSPNLGPSGSGIGQSRNNILGNLFCVVCGDTRYCLKNWFQQVMSLLKN